MKKRLMIISCMTMLLVVGFYIYDYNQIKEYKKSFTCRNTTCQITLYSKHNMNKELNEVIEYYQNQEERLDHEIKKLNTKKGQVPVSKEVLTMIKQLNDMDIYINNQTLTELWEKRLNEETLPTNEELKTTFSYINKIEVGSSTLDSSVYDMNIDSYRSGYLSRKVKVYLRKKKISSYSLNFGGNITVGKHYKDIFHSAVLNPISNEIVKIIKKDDVSIYTAGTDPKMINGNYYVPIIDPNTKYPYNYHTSVTVVSKDPILANMLSYKLYAMNLTSGKEFVKQYDVENVIWVEKDGEVETFAK